MGYTVYWSQSGQRKFSKEYVDDVKRLCKCATENTAPIKLTLGDGCGENEPIITEELIALNGKGKQGYEGCVIDCRGASEFEFTKTARQDYDYFIKALLLLTAKYGYVYNITCDDGYRDDSGPDFNIARKFLKENNFC